MSVAAVSAQKTVPGLIMTVASGCSESHMGCSVFPMIGSIVAR